MTIRMGRVSFTLTPSIYRRITLVAGILIAIIIVTGAAVRLTNSGLGCSSWPNCEAGQLVAHPESSTHQKIESANRLFTGLVSVGVIAAVLGAFLRRPRRRDLLWLSGGLVAGVMGQIVLGGITVLVDLHPAAVMSHFLLSMLLLADAIVLYHRAGIPDGDGRATCRRRRRAVLRSLPARARDRRGRHRDRRHQHRSARRRQGGKALRLLPPRCGAGARDRGDDLPRGRDHAAVRRASRRRARPIAARDHCPARRARGPGRGRLHAVLQRSPAAPRRDPHRRSGRRSSPRPSRSTSACSTPFPPPTRPPSLREFGRIVEPSSATCTNSTPRGRLRR